MHYISFGLNYLFSIDGSRKTNDAVRGNGTNTQTIGIHATGAMKYYILMFHGTEEGVLETMRTVPIAGVGQGPFKVL